MDPIKTFYSGISGVALPVAKSQYPPEFHEKSRLHYYASLFNSVEVNSIFYKLPRSSTVANWAESVPDDFRFTFKVSKTITHVKGLDFAVKDVDDFIKTVDNIGTLFDTISRIPVSYIVIGLIILFYTLEQLLSGPFSFNKRSDHFFNNFSFQVLITGITFLFAIVQVFAIQYINQHHWGLFNQINISSPAKIISGIAAFDFISYWFHRVSHKFPLLWKLHRVHHSDTTMDCSTFFRHHPLEVFVSGSASILAAAIFGLDIKTLEIFIIVSITFMIAQHANISFPRWIDITLGKIFITPNLHKVHHSQNRVYTDSNYADIFVFWDILFGTYKYVPVQNITYGLVEFKEEKKQSFWYLLKSPFIRSQSPDEV